MSDYNGYLYPLKDRLVKIFKIIKKRYANDKKNELLIKEYQHPKSMSLRAYVRQQVAKEDYSFDSHNDSSTFLIVINYRKNIDVDCYVEFKEKIMKVIAVDAFEDRNLELKLTCQLVPFDLEIIEVRGVDET